MVNVCHITTVHSALDVRIFYKECSSLSKKGYFVNIIAPGSDCRKNGIFIHGIGKQPSSRIKRIIQMSQRAYKKALKIDADIYHIHDPELLPVGNRLLKKGKKVIFDSHEDVVAQIGDKKWIPAILRNLAKFCYQFYQKKILFRYTALIGASPHICRRLEESGNKRVFLIKNYPILGGDYKTSDIVNFKNKLVFAGGINEQWMHNKIIQAIGAIDDIKYVLCGPAEEIYLNQLKKLYGWKKVDYLGEIPHSDVKKILSSCGIGLALLEKSGNTGGQEGTLGNTKLFEYMQAGLPVICTDFDLWKEIVEKWDCGLCINPYDTKNILDAINILLSDKRRAAFMGNNGKKAIISEYNWNIEEEKIMQLYNEVSILV